MRVILASASPRRQELLKNIFPEFMVCPAQMEESVPEGLAVQDGPVYLATEKAKCVALDHPDDLVIGCDTVVVWGDEMLGKPADAADAYRMLQSLSGKTHQVITGCCLVYGGRIHSFSETTSVEFRNLTAAEMEAYIATGEPFDKAGAYGIQGKGGDLVAAVHGDFYNVVGLPVERLRREIEGFVG